MKRHISIFAFLLSAFAAVGLSAFAAGSGSDFMRLSPIGYRLGEAGDVRAYDSSVVTVAPSDTSIVTSNKSQTLTAVLNRDYKVVRWQKFGDDPTRRTELDPIEEFGEKSETVAVDFNPNVEWMYVTVVVKYNPVRTVKVDLSSFAKGTVTISPEKPSYQKGDVVTLTAEPAEGYSFVRWSDGNADHVRTLTVDDDIDLTAYIEPDSSRVSFSAGAGAVLGVTSKRVSFGSAYGELPVPTRDGLVFTGWADVNGRVVTEKTKVDRSLDHTLYAQWEIPPESYVVVFDANGGTGLQTRVEQKFEVGVSQKLHINTFYNTGHVFVGWNQNAKAEEMQFKDEQIVQDLAPAGAALTLFAVWRAEKVAYTVHFDKNAQDATGEMIDQQFAGGEEKPLSGCNFKRTGWTFLGWSTDSKAVEAAYQDRERVQDLTTQKELTFYAVWTRNPVYYISYMATDKDTDPRKETVEQGKEYTLSTNGYERTGYTFTGWTNGTAKATYPAGKKCTTQELAKMVDDGDAITFVAVWKPITYTLKFDGNGGRCNVPEEKLEYDDKRLPYTINVNRVPGERDPQTVRTHYTLIGWNRDSAGKGEVFELGLTDNYQTITITNNLTAVDGTNVTLYAIWQGKPQIVVINGELVELEYGSQLEKPDDPAPKSGYTFTGEWHTNNNVTVSFPITVTGGFDLNPNETTNEYTVVFHGTDADGGATEPQAFTYDVAQALTANGFTRPGYGFAGWAVREGADRTVAYADRQVVKNLATNDGAVVDLYATWTMNPRYYVVRYNPNGGAGTPYVQDIECGVATALTANGFTRTGYGFAGWAVAESSGSTVVYTNGQIVTDLADEGETNNLWAVWTPNRYWVKFDGNGANGGTMAVQAFTYDALQALTVNGFTRTGYGFAGWKTNETGAAVFADGAVVSNLTAEADATNTLWATWKANTYTVRFNPNGGSGDITTQGFTYDQSQKLTGNDFEPPEALKSFAGWATNETGKAVYANGAEVQNLTAEADGTVDLYAVWGDDSYTVAFDGNGATGGTMEPQAFKHGGTDTLTPNAYLRTGCGFSGWATNLTDKVVYSDGANFTAPTNGTGETLYAVWTNNTYECTFVGKTEDNQRRKYGEKLDPLPGNLPKTGYTFEGWTTNGSDVVVLESFTMPDHDVVFTPLWTPITYTIAFDGNGTTTVAMAPTNVKYDVEIALPSNTYVWAGHEFVSWTNSVGSVFEDGKTVKNLSVTDGATVTLYADWQKVGNPLSIALGLSEDWNTESVGNAWSVIGSPTDKSGLQRSSTDESAWLEITIPDGAAGELYMEFDNGTSNRGTLVITLDGNEIRDSDGEWAKYQTDKWVVLPEIRSGVLRFKGCPDSGCTWKLQNFKWTAK